MKLTVPQSDLHAAVALVSRATAPRSTLLITTCVQLEADAVRQTLTLTATDLAVRLTRTISAQVERSGAICLPAALFRSLVSHLTGLITLVCEKEQVTLKAGPARAKLPGLPAADFPPGAVAEADGSLSLSRDLFGYLVERVSHAAAADDNRPILTGVLAQVKDGELVLAAADGYRLAVDRWQVDSGEQVDLVVPARAFALVDSLNGEQVTLRWHPGRLAIESEQQTTLTIQLLEGRFPSYVSLIPTESACWLVVDRKALAAAVELVAPLSNQIGRSGSYSRILCWLTPEGLKVAGLDTEGRRAETVVPATPTADLPVRFGLDRTYLRDALRYLTGERVQIGWSNPSSPLVFRPLEGQQIEVVMPLFVDWEQITRELADGQTG